MGLRLTSDNSKGKTAAPAGDGRGTRCAAVVPLPVGWEEMGVHLAFCLVSFGDALLLNTSWRGRFPDGLINKLVNWRYPKTL